MENGLAMLRVLLLVLACAAEVWSDCVRIPPPRTARSGKSPGDNGFKILINGDIERYVPETLYTVTLVGSRTHDRLQQFTRFMLTSNPRDPTKESSHRTQGQFQLFADTLSTFSETCVNTIVESDDLPKTEVQVMWKAPQTGSGCVYIRAMVFENSNRWFADDGQLSRLVCEQTRREIKKSEDECCACDDAKYSMTFEGLWSNVTHPKDFPFTLWLTHFSDVIGASHDKNFSFWGEGQISSDGFRSLAEWGSVRLMEQELRQQSSHIKTIIKASGLWYPHVNSNTSSSFKVNRKRNYVSLASMFGPSPDWVVGVNGLNLCQKDCSWLESKIIDLYPYDAGTDGGITYMSPNSETSPREKMYRITTMYPEDPRAPFYDPSKTEMNPMARLYLNRVQLIPRGCDEEVLLEQIVDVAENTEDTSRPECAVTEYTPWSACSVSCGKGLRMRTREYIMSQKAQMLGCSRQLVSKEMCVADIPECETQGAVDTEDDLSAVGPGDEFCSTTEWGPWSDCSEDCGVGVIMRRRQFINQMGHKKCPQINLVDKDKCMQPACAEGQIELPDPMCPTTEWSDWSPCSASCGKGVKMRSRLPLVEPGLQEKCSTRLELVQQRPCVEQSDCTFDMGTAKKVCMEEADPGPCRGVFNRWHFNSQKMMCVPFVYFGCRGNKNNFLTSDECTEVCGVVRDAILGNANPEQGFQEAGAQVAYPNRNVQPDQYNQFDYQQSLRGNSRTFGPQSYALEQQRNQLGTRRVGDNFAAGPNDLDNFANRGERIDCMVTDWSDWTPCSSSCGNGFQEKFRMIKLQAQNGGTPCPRKVNKRRRCQGPPCTA